LERAGIDIVSDGEARRESYTNYFATRLGGIDLDHPGTIRRGNRAVTVPRVVGPITHPHPVMA
jgi:5-methyltetrahydropteroyltriglutamate--homocysteine methyltransferase